MKKLLLLSLLAGMVILSLGIGKAEAITVTTTLTDNGNKVDVAGTATAVSSEWLYSYVLTYVNHDIYNFRIYNSYFPMNSITSPDDWVYTVPFGGGYITWVTFGDAKDPVTSSKSPLGGFSFRTWGPPGPVTVQAWNSGNTLWGGNVGPTPEPSSMILLGMGLFGFAGRAMRKRFKA